MRPEEIDLADLSLRVRAELPEGEPVGYLRGKALLRDTVQRLVGCSELEAEELVDTLELRGYFHFEADPARRARADAQWDINAGHEL